MHSVKTWISPTGQQKSKKKAQKKANPKTIQNNALFKKLQKLEKKKNWKNFSVCSYISIK